MLKPIVRIIDNAASDFVSIGIAVFDAVIICYAITDAEIIFTAYALSRYTVRRPGQRCPSPTSFADDELSA